MKNLALLLVFCGPLMIGRPDTVAAITIPAIATSVGKAILKYFGKEGGEQATEYLSRKGGQEIVERVTKSAAKQGGEEAVEQVARLTGKYGPEALAALDNTPSIMPVIRALDELPESQAKLALARLAAGKPGRELADAVGRNGAAALRVELQHPGVGLFFVRALGDDGVELASKLSADQAIVVARHADNLAKLPSAQRSGVLQLLRQDTDRMVGFMGRFVEANPGKTLFSVAATTVILAEPERILGGDEVVFDADGNPVVVRKGGIADRTFEAGGDVASHVSEKYLRPVYLAVASFAGVFTLFWLSLKYWQFRKLRRATKLLK